MKFDTGAAPRGFGIVEVDLIREEKTYTVGKIDPGGEHEVDYLVFKDGTVGVARKEVRDTSEEMKIKCEKELLRICSTM